MISRRVLQQLRATGIAAALAYMPMALAQPGALDPSFGQGGVVTPSADIGHMAVAADGRIAITRTAIDWNLPHAPWPADVFLYQSNGSPDPSFGQGGQITTSEFYVVDDLAIAFQSSGRIVLGGKSKTARFLGSGILDQTFGTNGYASSPAIPAGEYISLSAVTVAPDDRMFRTGQVCTGAWCNFAIVAYGQDGHLDTSFGLDGLVGTYVGSDFASVSAMTVVPAGIGGYKILVGGDSNAGWHLARYSSTGGLDPSFGDGGKVTTSFDRNSGNVVDVASGPYQRARIGALAVKADGKVVAAGWTCPQSGPPPCALALVRYALDGSVDSSFDNGVKSGFTDWYGSVAIRLLADGKVLVAAGAGNAVLARFNADGSLDAGFGDNGIIRLGMGVSDIGFQPDGKLLVSGWRSGGGQAILARFLTESAGEATPLMPENGLWIIDTEQGGPGRGFQIEVQRGSLMMAVNGYESDGRATFHLASGAYANGSFVGELTQYAGGIALGGAPRSAHATGSAGPVSLQFTDRTHGMITLPGEAPKAIGKFDFGTPPSSAVNARPVTGLWTMEAERNGNPGRGFLLEAQDDYLVMVFDGYTAAGDATFYYASGPLNYADWSADLGMYAGGIYFGATPRTAHWVGSAGQAKITFDSATTGWLTLPGEATQVIRKFDFGFW